MKTALFVCVHNAGRSQMAEAFVNHLAAARSLPVRAESAGTVAGARINPVAEAVMREVGISMDGQHPKQLTQEMADAADRVITMGCGVDADACPARIYLSEDWGLDDPKDLPVEKVRAIRDGILRRVEAQLAEMTGAEPTPPIACNLGAFDVAQRNRYGKVVDGLRAVLLERRELADGWAFIFPSDAGVCALAMEFATLERLCCPFWTFRLELAPQNRPLTLSLTGPSGAKELLKGFLD